MKAYWYRARTFSPSLGRFFQRDPLGYADGANPYAYVGNGPWGAVDPSGTMAKMTFGQKMNALAMGALWDTPIAAIGGIFNMIAHPVDTVVGVVSLAYPPNAARLAGALIDQTVEDWKTVRGRGRIIGNLASLLSVGSKAASAGRNVSKEARLAEGASLVERGAAGASNFAAKEILPGGTGKAIAVHGVHEWADDMVQVPKNITSVTRYVAHGTRLSDTLGLAIEDGATFKQVSELAKGLAEKYNNPRIFSNLEEKIYKTGEWMPNYTAYPPKGLRIRENLITVTRPTRLSDLLPTISGDVHWAACAETMY